MPLYSYKAKNLSGEEKTGQREAKDKRDLARLIRSEGYILVSTSEEGNSKKDFITIANEIFARFFGHVSLEDKLMFARNLGVMVRAGLAITRALEVLEKQTESPVFKKVISDIGDRIRKGSAFSESLRAHPKVFSSLFVAMVEAGEVSGKLDEALDVLASQMKNDYELRRKVKGAMMYPAVIVVVMIIIGILMMIYVVPTLTTTFKELGVDLPVSTKFIIGTSDLLANAGLYIFLILAIVGYGLYTLSRTPLIKRWLDVVVIKLPVIGGLAKQMNAARTARTMGSLIASGVPILKAIEITQNVLQNHLFRNVLVQAAKDIEKGSGIADSFTRQENLYPVLVGEMIAVGEETGKTSDMLRQLAEFYENEVSTATKDLSSIIEPVLMVMIGSVVGFFALSMIQPLYGSIATGF